MDNKEGQNRVLTIKILNFIALIMTLTSSVKVFFNSAENEAYVLKVLKNIIREVSLEDVMQAVYENFNSQSANSINGNFMNTIINGIYFCLSIRQGIIRVNAVSRSEAWYFRLTMQACMSYCNGPYVYADKRGDCYYIKSQVDIEKV